VSLEISGIQDLRNLGFEEELADFLLNPEFLNS
jgi:hypothetical protein